MRTLLTLIFVLSTVRSFADTYYVHPEGNDANSGLTVEKSWKSIDRGQPTLLLNACKPGDTELSVVKANQFPASGKVLVNNVEVSYTGRSLQKLTGCSNVPKASAEAKVRLLDSRLAGAGDTIVVKQGVYYLPFEKAPELKRLGFAVAMFFRGGKQGSPLRIVGDGYPIVDARDEGKIASISIQGDSIELSGLDVRRGGIVARYAKEIKIADCRVHEGRTAINAYGVETIEIVGNKVYDMIGAWTSHGIAISRCSNVAIRNNTIVSNAYAVKVQSCQKVIVANNLIAWCRSGIINDKTDASDLSILDNNIWWVGHGIWLQRDDQNDTRNTRYKGCDPGKGDFSADPLIVEWNPNKADFLSPLATSPCVKDGKVWVGAGHPAKAYPRIPQEPLIFNPSFETGFRGWFLDTWVPFRSGQAGWAIVNEPGCEGEKCLELFDYPTKGKRINVRAQSLSFRYNRGTIVRITFMAKAQRDDSRISVGITVPSWHNSSGLSQHVKLSQEWKTYRVDISPKTRFPDCATVTFTTSENVHCWIDAVSVQGSDQVAISAEEGEASALLPKLEIVPDYYSGTLVPEEHDLRGSIVNRTRAPVSGMFDWTLSAPLRGEIASGSKKFDVSGASSPFHIPLDEKLTGIFFLRYRFATNGTILAKGDLRFSRGEAPDESRNHSFFAATPPSLTNWFPGELLDKQMEALAALGLGTLHQYMGYKQINELMYDSRASNIPKVTEKYGLNWMFTPSDAKALTGKATWAPAPGNIGPNAIEVKRDDLKGERCSETQLQAWEAAVGMMVEKYRGQIKSYEILNEPNTFLNGAEYEKVLLRTSRLIRKIDPQATIIAGSVVNAPRKELWNATMSTPPGTFDAFSYHPYRFGLTNPESEDESFRRELLSCQADLAKHGHKPVVWLTEEGMGPGWNETRCIGLALSHSGYPRFSDFHEGEIRQALYGTRMYLTALGEGAAGYSYHTLKNMITDSHMSPMLILKSIHTMDSILGDATPLGKLDIEHDFICYLFENSDRAVVAAIWMKDAEYGIPVEARFGAEIEFKAFDAFGMASLVRDGASGKNVRIDRSATYFIFEKDATSEAVKNALKVAFRGVHSVPGTGDDQK